MVPTYLPTYLRCSTASASIRDARTLFLRACPRCSWFSPIHFSTFLFINSMYVCMYLCYFVHIMYVCMYVLHLYGVYIEVVHLMVQNIRANRIYCYAPLVC